MLEQDKDKIAGIILAAGGSRRMGEPKLLLPWRGKPILQHAVQTALDAGLAPVLVVAGVFESEIASALKGLDAAVIKNPAWRIGQSASIKIGIQAILDLPEGKPRAVIFLLGDQPQIPADLVRAIVAAYDHTGEKIVAPSVGGKRANPVLFDRSLFQELLALNGDIGARQIFSRIPPHLVPWEDESIFFDIDTPYDYQQLISHF